MSVKHLFAAGWLVLAMGTSAHAVVSPVFDNMAQSAIPGLSPDSIALDGPIGASFTTSSTTTSLGSVSLLLMDASDSLGSFIVFIAPDDGLGNPDLTLADSVWRTVTPVADSAVTSDANGYWELSFTGTNGVTVAPNTTYWMVVQDFASSAVGWAIAVSSAGIGDIYNESFYAGGGAAQNQEGPYVMSVSVNDAPEPASLAILGAGLSGMGLLRWRKRRRG